MAGSDRNLNGASPELSAEGILQQNNGTAASHAELKESSRSSEVPTHIAVIMDGNGRWAKSKFFPRLEGHRAGAKTVRMIVEEARRLGVRYLTLFSFSTENWQRPEEEVSGLMKLFAHYLENEKQLLLNNNIRLRSIGERNRLPVFVRDLLTRVEEETKQLDGMDLILALSYGGRDEIVHMAQNIARAVEQGRLSSSAVSQEVCRGFLYAPDIPDPDLLIRTSDEHRISNFLLWQLAYSEIVVSKLRWPEFSKEEFHRCLKEFAGRTRRFGLTDEQHQPL